MGWWPFLPPHLPPPSPARPSLIPFIARPAHPTRLLQGPGLGDDIQAIKAGVLEIADILVVNKSDRPGAGELKRDLAMMLTLGGHTPPGGWTVTIADTVAATGVGVDKLVVACGNSGTGLAWKPCFSTTSYIDDWAVTGIALPASTQLAVNNLN